MSKVDLHLDPIESLFNFLQVCCQLAEKSTVVALLFVKNALVHLQVEANQFNVAGHSRVYLAIVQLDGRTEPSSTRCITL